MHGQMGEATPIFDQILASAPGVEPREVVLIFEDGSEVAWPINDPRARPFVMLARTLLGRHPLNPETGMSEGQ